MLTNQDLFFEARELKRGAVYVPDSELVEGRTYFQVYCLDERATSRSSTHWSSLDEIAFRAMPAACYRTQKPP